MAGGFHGEEELAFVVCELPQPLQQSVITRAAVTDGEGPAHGPALRVDDTDHMAALGDVDSYDKHGKHHPAEICRQSSQSYESYPASR